VRGAYLREQGDAEDYAAAGISSTLRSMSRYQRLKMAPNSALARNAGVQRPHLWRVKESKLP
jgi:hypothetical protein